MPDLQARRKLNLKALIRQWEGPTNLARKLAYSGPSYLSQLTGTHKPITEKTARYIETAVDLPAGWLDQDHTDQVTNGRVDSGLINRVMLSVGAALEEEGMRLLPTKMADLVTFVYECSQDKGVVDDGQVSKLIKLMKGWSK